MIDASFVLAPKQRNSRAENNQIKQGKGSDLWKDKPRKNVRKTLMPDGPKRRGSPITAIKLTSKPISDRSLLIPFKPPRRMCMTRK